MPVGLVTDSTSALPADVCERYQIDVVPIEVVVDGQGHPETDLDRDTFYRLLNDGSHEITTSQPSPGRFAAAYARAAAGGADEVISVHVSDQISGTLNAARLAAADAPIPVHLVDTGTASFGVGLAVWEAADALADGASAAEAERRAMELAARLHSVFVVDAGALADSSRVRSAAIEPAPGETPVLHTEGPDVDVIGMATTGDEAVAMMADGVLRAGGPLRVAVGAGDATALSMADALADLMAASDEVADVIRYRVAPSVAVHTGAGTSGAFYYRVA